MPTYDYECENCGNTLNDIYQSINDKPLKKCASCGKHSLYRVIHAPYFSVKGEPTSIIQLAEQNSNRMGKSKVEDMSAKDKENKKQALSEAKKEMRTKINSMSESQKRRYINDGKI